MNFFETIYCSQYYELRKSGRDPQKGRLNGTLLSATILILGIVSAAVIMNKILPGYFSSHFFSDAAETGFSGKAMGKVLGALALLIFGGLLNFTIGSKTNYERMMLKWEWLPEHELEKTIKTSLKIFGITFGIFLLIIVGNFV
ncbi:hypothetical protein BH09BAC6_BH09BAC6_35860 [soil metagenome]|jgi:hypothetical protein